MLYAVTDSDPQADPSPSSRGRCPSCAGEVIARCGQVNAWHWAHVAGHDCDSWAEPSTDWHRAYQRMVPRERCEVRMGDHRADLVGMDGFVVELQHSSIAVQEIAEREAHYGKKMMWLFDARAAFLKGRLGLRRGNKDDYVNFRWRQPRRSIVACERRVLLDLGEGLVLSIRKLYPGPPCAGWGHVFETRDIWEWMRSGRRPIPVPYSQVADRRLDRSILAYQDYLSSGPLADDAEVTRLLRATMFPGKTPPADFVKALKQLELRGQCPPAMEHLTHGLPDAVGTWITPPELIEVVCPRCEYRHRIGMQGCEGLDAPTQIPITCGYGYGVYMLTIPATIGDTKHAA